MHDLIIYIKINKWIFTQENMITIEKEQQGPQHHVIIIKTRREQIIRDEWLSELRDISQLLNIMYVFEGKRWSSIDASSLAAWPPLPAQRTSQLARSLWRSLLEDSDSSLLLVLWNFEIWLPFSFLIVSGETFKTLRDKQFKIHKNMVYMVFGININTIKFIQNLERQTYIIFAFRKKITKQKTMKRCEKRVYRVLWNDQEDQTWWWERIEVEESTSLDNS